MGYAVVWGTIEEVEVGGKGGKAALADLLRALRDGAWSKTRAPKAFRSSWPSLITKLQPGTLL